LGYQSKILSGEPKEPSDPLSILLARRKPIRFVLETLYKLLALSFIREISSFADTWLVPRMSPRVDTCFPYPVSVGIRSTRRAEHLTQLSRRHRPEWLFQSF